MKLYISIAVVLAFLAFTQAQDYYGQSEDYVSPSDHSNEPNPRPPRPGKSLFLNLFPRLQLSGEPQFPDSEGSGSYLLRLPSHRPVYFNIQINVGSDNHDYQTTTAYYEPETTAAYYDSA